MFRFVQILMPLLLAATVSHAEESPNYCLDADANQEWTRIYSNNPDDNDIAKLFALRTGLCEMVRRKAITIERATKIFEEERERTVFKQKQEIIRERNRTPIS